MSDFAGRLSEAERYADSLSGEEAVYAQDIVTAEADGVGWLDTHHYLTPEAADAIRQKLLSIFDKD